ncbi:hypothetical protein Phum_PHUM499070 [Pediculus humanus corporis]|uniref:Uncharacterized protein n=1 Tax=Pediculus humanus subsp. corporis TaxID=121224 RepID=E0VXE4_PEDHC|nr:uncharacterized protein Phum_PHUM499070 [Pediculus humanus corporis]EEB18050.1 hypothetical protein Phum_PHUM499070 [Pediculus humanus corporis]
MKLPELLKPLENKAELKVKGLALFGKLIRTKNVDKLQGETVILGVQKTNDDKKQKLQIINIMKLVVFSGSNDYNNSFEVFVL